MSLSSGGLSNVYLPPELLKEVFKHVERKANLAQYCLISKTWYAYAIPWLYEWVYVYTWHKAAKAHVRMILRTLASCERLAFHVKLLEFRDFPTHLDFEERRRLESLSVQALSNCVNLRICSLTRNGTLSTEILDRLAGLEHLQELEINGQPGAWGVWVPEDLLVFRRLRGLTLIMPSRTVVEVLPALVAQNVSTLESLVVVCKFTTYLNDAFLQSMKPVLRKLRRFHLAGCIKVTEGSIRDILSESDNLQSLALEGCSPNFDMSVLAATCAEQGVLRSLTSITLTIPVYNSSEQRHIWLDHVLLMLRDSPLESFQLYASGGSEDTTSYTEVGDRGIRKLVDSHTSTLRRIGIQRLIVPLESLGYACERCPRLEEVFATLCNADRDAVAQALAPGKSLRNLHLSLMTDVAGRLQPLHLLTAHDACLHIARSCGESLQVIGSQTKAWHVRRRVFDERTVVSLDPYTGHRIPEQFLMMRS